MAGLSEVRTCTHLRTRTAIKHGTNALRCHPAPVMVCPCISLTPSTCHGTSMPLYIADTVLPRGVNQCDTLRPVQGAQCPTQAYVALAKAIQLASPLQLYISIPAFPLDVAEPAVLNSGMSRVLCRSNLRG